MIENFLANLNQTIDRFAQHYLSLFFSSIAVLIPALYYWRRSLRRPELVLSFNNEDDNHHFFGLVGRKEKARSHFLRIKVENKGNLIAKACKGEIISVERETGEALPHFFSEALYWSQDKKFKPIDIYSNEAKYLDFCYGKEGDSGLYLATKSAIGLKSGVTERLGEGWHKVKIGVYSANGKIVFLALKIIWDGNWETLKAEVIEEKKEKKGLIKKKT